MLDRFKTVFLVICLCCVIVQGSCIVALAERIEKMEKQTQAIKGCDTCP